MYDDDADRQEAERELRRAIAAARHSRNLAILDALLGLEGEATPGPWRAVPVPAERLQGDVAKLRGATGRAVTPDAWSGWDAALVAALRTGARGTLSARRRVLERHAPNPCGNSIDCARCVDGQENQHLWPCEDYTDAEAGLVMPHRVMLLPDQAGRQVEATCVCCGWSRFEDYSSDARTASRRADDWGLRHVDGDPAAQGDDAGADLGEVAGCVGVAYAAGDGELPAAGPRRRVLAEARPCPGCGTPATTWWELAGRLIHTRAPATATPAT